MTGFGTFGQKNIVRGILSTLRIASNIFLYLPQ